MKTLFNRVCHLLLFPGIVFLLTVYAFANNTSDIKSGGGDIQPLPKGVYIHQLDNGMQVLLIENPALPMVGVNVVVKVGSAYPIKFMMVCKSRQLCSSIQYCRKKNSKRKKVL
jgi:hypothetical protein